MLDYIFFLTDFVLRDFFVSFEIEILDPFLLTQCFPETYSADEIETSWNQWSLMKTEKLYLSKNKSQ